MRKNEKIIAAVLTMVFGVLFMLLKSDLIGLLMTILGSALIVFGIIDLVNKVVPLAVCKLVFGVVIIVLGWVLFTAVLYVLSACLLIVGILAIYDLVRYKFISFSFKNTACLIRLAEPVLCVIIGLILLFEPLDWVFIVAGIFTFIEGVVLLINAIRNE